GYLLVGGGDDPVGPDPLEGDDLLNSFLQLCGGDRVADAGLLDHHFHFLAHRARSYGGMDPALAGGDGDLIRLLGGEFRRQTEGGGRQQRGQAKKGAHVYYPESFPISSEMVL